MKNKLFIILILIVSNSIATITKHQKPTEPKKRFFLTKLAETAAGWFGAKLPPEVKAGFQAADNPVSAVIRVSGGGEKAAGIADAVMESGRQIAGTVIQAKTGINPVELVDNVL